MAEFIDFFVDRSLAFIPMFWHEYMLHLLAEMYDFIGIHELSKKGQGTTPKVTKYMLAEIYDFIGNKC